tara:strand:+ start:202 stop:393 length:192 start_codon:yes stop_codon:yes gene_type:complete
MAKKTVKKTVKKIQPVNPFDAGVSYDRFLEALGNTPIEKYLNGVCDNDQIEWIKTEITNLKNK